MIRSKREDTCKFGSSSTTEAPGKGANAMLQLLAKIRGIGLETANLLVYEILSRNLRDRRAVARYAGPTGTPDESGPWCMKR